MITGSESIPKNYTSISIKFIKFTVISYAYTLLFLLAFSLLFTYTSVSEELMPLFVKIISASGALICGLLCTSGISSKGWRTGAISGLLYISFITLIALIFKLTDISLSTFADIVLHIFSGSAGGIIGINLKNK